MEYPGQTPIRRRYLRFFRRDVLEPKYRPWRLGATLFSIFGVLAAVVAVVGVFSTVSYGVGQRTHEFGVRVALGAQVGDIVATGWAKGSGRWRWGSPRESRSPSWQGGWWHRCCTG